jgi:hypothetical protein
MSETHEPIFILGRQHCGNTMLATMLGQHPDVHAFTGEGNFFEHIDSIQSESLDERRRRVVREILHGAGGGRDNLREDLSDYLQDETKLRGALALYAEGRAALARREGATRWAQKATSYVFHVERILRAFPDARCVFLVRNPLDLAASVQRRGYFQNHIARTIWGWNTGVRRALDLVDHHRSGIRIHRYEDLVRQPEEELKRILDFCDLSFSAGCLDIPHVNPSENSYAEADDSSGVNTSRVYYYPHVLSTEDEMAVRALASDELLEPLYPDLPSPRGAFGWRSTYRVGILMAKTVLSGTRQHAGMMFQDPGHAVRRLKKRLLGT